MKRLLTAALILALLAALLIAAAAPASAETECSHEWKLQSVRKEPTCTEAGTGVYRCTKCGKTKTDTVKALGHKWGKWQTVKEPTCGKEGSESRSCSRCGKKQTRSVPPTYKHKWKWQTVKEPTCGEEGSRRQICSVCKLQNKTETIPATGKHDFGKWKVTKKASCEKDGRKTRTCKVCGHKETEAIPATGHDWDEGKVTREPSALQEGEITYTCRNDPSHTKTESVPVKKFAVRKLGNPLDYDPLVIVKQPVGGSLSMKKGGSFTLSLEVEGGCPPYLYTWRSRDIWMNYEETPELKTILGTGAPYLTVTEGVPGVFCEVSDMAGNRVYSDIVRVDSEFAIVEQPKNKQLYEGGGSAFLTCRAVGGQPYDNGTYIYAWYDEAGNQIEFSDHGDVVITKPGKYYCVVEDAGTGHLTSDTVTVGELNEPFHLVGLSDEVLYLDEGQFHELWAEFGGGKLPYNGLWLCGGELESATVRLEDHLFTTHAFGTGKITRYILTATDSADGIQTVSVEVRPQHLVIGQQPEGGMLNRDGAFGGLDVTVSGGEPPYTFTLICEGETRYTAVQDSGSFGMPVYQPGYYWYRISDTTGCTVESQTAVVREREFTLSLESSGKIPPNGKAVVTAVVDGAEEPVEYRWWWLGDMETGEGATSLPETGETCSASRPGEYRCLATDDAGNFKSDYITVEAEGTAPIITKQPEGFTFPWQEDLTCYSAALSCDAEAYDGAKDVLEYRWEYHYGTGNWGGSQTGREFPLPKLTQGGFFRCIVTDTRSGEKTTSETAVIRIIMTCEAKSTTGLYHSNLKYTIRGGMGPFTIRVYARRIQGEYEDGTPFYHEELLHTTIREKSTGYITLPDAVPYEYPGWDGGNIITRKAIPELYIVVEDHSNQVAVSFSEAN